MSHLFARIELRFVRIPLHILAVWYATSILRKLFIGWHRIRRERGC